jgi:hypothetical protein
MPITFNLTLFISNIYAQETCLHLLLKTNIKILAVTPGLRPVFFSTSQQFIAIPYYMQAEQKIKKFIALVCK